MTTIRRTAKKLVGAFARDKKGSTAIAMAILTPVIVAGLAFGSEAGSWEMTKRRLQNSTDSAAFAAGTQLRSGLSESDMTTAALHMANNSGFNLMKYGETDQTTIDSSSGTLTLNSPPLIEPYASQSDAKNYIHIETETVVQRKFSKLFLADPITIRTSAVAAVQSGRPACVLSLDPTAAGAVTVSGSATVGLSGCDVAANSISSSAFDQDGNGQIETECISVVGGVDYNKESSVTLSDPECPEAIENAPVTADPYRNRNFPVDPATLGCTNKAKWNQNNGAPDSGKKYCNGSNVNGTVTIDVDPSNPWIILDGGNWMFTANADFTAEGVTIYLTGGADLDINGNADFRVKAPQSGDLTGIAIFIDRAETGTYKFSGGAGIEIVGALYAASATIEMLGNVESSGAGECSQIIGGKVTFSGTSDFDTDCSNSGTTSVQVAESIKIVR